MPKFDFSIITITKQPNIRWLAETINSIQSQSFRNFEHIILDASNNQAYSKIEELVKNFESNNIVLKKQVSTGIWPAFNEAYDLSNGEYVGVVNSDDFYYDDDVLETVINELNLNDLDYCYGNSQRVDKNRRKLYLHKPLKFLNKNNYDFFVFNISHHTLFFKKAILNDIKFYPSTTNAVDLDFMRRLFHSHYKGKYINKTIAGFRIHENNFSSSYSKKDTMKLFVEWNSLPSFFFILSRIVIFIFNPKYCVFYITRFFRKLGRIR